MASQLLPVPIPADYISHLLRPTQVLLRYIQLPRFPMRHPLRRRTARPNGLTSGDVVCVPVPGVDLNPIR